MTRSSDIVPVGKLKWEVEKLPEFFHGARDFEQTLIRGNFSPNIIARRVPRWNLRTELQVTVQGPRTEGGHYSATAVLSVKNNVKQYRSRKVCHLMTSGGLLVESLLDDDVEFRVIDGFVPGGMSPGRFWETYFLKGLGYGDQQIKIAEDPIEEVPLLPYGYGATDTLVDFRSSLLNERNSWCTAVDRLDPRPAIDIDATPPDTDETDPDELYTDDCV